MSRGLRWHAALSATTDATAGSVRVADVDWSGERARIITVGPNRSARFPRARGGQVGIEEGWAIASEVRDAIEQDRHGTPRAIVPIVDAPGQAFGVHEEALALHLSLAAAADAYASARLAGHPVVALIVGKAISGAFLAHGLQAGALIALDDGAVEVHVMSQASVARVTRRSEEEVAALARVVPSTARDIHSFASLGAIDHLLAVDSADSPTARDVQTAKTCVIDAIRELRARPRGPRERLGSSEAQRTRALSLHVRKLLEEQWDAPA